MLYDHFISYINLFWTAMLIAIESETANAKLLELVGLISNASVPPPS
jgi:hypothetical protein